MKDLERKVYFNGKFIPESKAKISIYDSALMFGDMVFEMTRSFNQKHFMLREHIDRLFLGLKILRIKIPHSKKELIEICHETSKQNKHLFEKDDEHRLMIDVSRGILGIYEDVVGVSKGPNVIVADFPLRWTVNGFGKLFDNGINMVITSQRAIPSHLQDPKIKNRSRLFYLNANIEASLFKGENNWALLMDPDGFIAEGAGDNFLIVKDNIVISPQGRNMLRGISRNYLMYELCKKLKIKVIEKNIEPYDVYEADEAFVTGTPFCMLPVTSLNSIKIGDGKVGKIFSKLLKEWSTRQNVDIKKQIQNWDKINRKKILKTTPYKF
ncbi:aminotransferase class IV [Candidatus Pelagibacter sp.]|nr:aminotransferase class IV [Candidatus Pelagibacter sp.]